jgi:hypothetical protein
MQAAMVIQPAPAMNGNYITIPAGPTMAPRAVSSEYVKRLFKQRDSEPKSVLDAPPLLDGGK